MTWVCNEVVYSHKEVLPFSPVPFLPSCRVSLRINPQAFIVSRIFKSVAFRHLLSGDSVVGKVNTMRKFLPESHYTDERFRLFAGLSEIAPWVV